MFAWRKNKAIQPVLFLLLVECVQASNMPQDMEACWKPTHMHSVMKQTVEKERLSFYRASSFYLLTYLTGAEPKVSLQHYSFYIVAKHFCWCKSYPILTHYYVFQALIDLTTHGRLRRRTACKTMVVLVKGRNADSLQHIVNPYMRTNPSTFSDHKALCFSMTRELATFCWELLFLKSVPCLEKTH